jgi:hypothetical protein
LDYEDIAGGGSMEDRMNTEDLYDGRPVQEMETVNEGRPLQERISLPGNRKNGQLIGTNDSGETDTAGKVFALKDSVMNPIDPKDRMALRVLISLHMTMAIMPKVLEQHETPQHPDKMMALLGPKKPVYLPKTPRS